MKFWFLTFGLLWVLAACSGGTGTTPESNGNAGETPVPEPAPEDVMENIEMHLWPAHAAPRQGQKPLLSIRASRFTGSAGGLDGGDEWTFEGADAIAPAQEEGETEIRFEAARGVFREEQHATLEGGVTAYVNDMTIDLENFIWEIGGESGEGPGSRAYSNQPLTINSPTQHLEASSIRLDPATSSFELTDVTGEIHFGGIEQ